MARYDLLSSDDLDRTLTEAVPLYGELQPDGRERLMSMARHLSARGWTPEAVVASLRSTAAVLMEEATTSASPLERPEVRAFMVRHGADALANGKTPHMVRETRAKERETLREMVLERIRAARGAYARHEAKRVRRDLLHIDQRELRRVLGREADDLCAQINELVRRTGARL
jgi:hypothetical protein